MFPVVRRGRGGVGQRGCFSRLSVSFSVPCPFRFITPEDEQWFNVQLVRAVEENISPEIASMIATEPYFVDFLRDMPEPTGDEPEDTMFEVPKIYELVLIFISQSFSKKKIFFFFLSMVGGGAHGVLCQLRSH